MIDGTTKEKMMKTLLALLTAVLVLPLSARAQDEKKKADAPKVEEKKTDAPKADTKADKKAGTKVTKKSGPKIRKIAWKTTFDEALAAAKKSERPILVDFTAEWCGWCKKLDRDTFGNEAVIRLVNEFFVAVKVDTDKSPAISKKYKVSGLPTLLILGPDGSELQRLTGYRPPEKFLTELGKSTETAESLKELKDVAAKNPKDLDAQRAYARAVFASGNVEEAVRALRIVLEKNPEDPALLLEIADMLRSSNKSKEARELYEKILALPAEKAGEHAANVYLPLARIQMSAKEFEASTKTLATFFKKHPKHKKRAEAHMIRAYAFSVLDNSKRAIADLEAVIALAPDSEMGIKAGYIVELVRTE